MFEIAGKYYLPKPYLSYSAMSSFLSYREDFRKRYYENKPMIITPELTFGKNVGEMVEDIINGKENITEKTYSEYTHGDTKVLIPHGNVAEQELKFEVDGIPILGYIDSFLTGKNYIFEMKTGKTPWTQGRVDKHFQLDVYSLGVETIFGKVDDECVLVWLETQRVEKKAEGRCTHSGAYEIEFTGRVKEFVRTITKEGRENAYNQIIKIAQDISEDYTDWLSTRGKTQSQSVVREGRVPFAHSSR